MFGMPQVLTGFPLLFFGNHSQVIWHVPAQRRETNKNIYQVFPTATLLILRGPLPKIQKTVTENTKHQNHPRKTIGHLCDLPLLGELRQPLESCFVFITSPLRRSEVLAANLNPLQWIPEKLAKSWAPPGPPLTSWLTSFPLYLLNLGQEVDILVIFLVACMVKLPTIEVDYIVEMFLFWWRLFKREVFFVKTVEVEHPAQNGRQHESTQSFVRPRPAPPQKVAFWKGDLIISGKSRLVKYYSIWPDLSGVCELTSELTKLSKSPLWWQRYSQVPLWEIDLWS